MALKMRRNKAGPPPEGCPLTECLALIGGAWTPNVIWYLSAGPRRFSELKADIGPVSAKVLSQRLRELQQRGVILRQVIDGSPPSVEYSLTDLGEELVPAITAIAKVGRKIEERMATQAPT